MATPFPSSSRMDAWSQRRGLQAMNLRSVFTPEQQRILERYYDNGMTNQSKACFQLILQCAQEAKLDFSVVRTWVGNKRRKLASRVDQNGGVTHSLVSHGLAGGLLTNHTLAGGALANHSMATGALLSADIAAARNIPNRVHLLPPSSSFPSFSTSSSSLSSSSSMNSISNNNHNNNNDVILTGIYSLNSASRPQPKPLVPPSQSDPDLSVHTHSSLISQVLQGRGSSTSSPLHSKLVSISQNLPSPTNASGPSGYTTVRKGSLPMSEAGAIAGTGVAPQTWSRQYGTAQTHREAQPQPRPHSNPGSQPVVPQKAHVSLPIQNAAPPSDQTPRIQQVFTLSEKEESQRLRPGAVTSQKGQECQRRATPPLDTSHNFSIAMETGDEADEWQREEELANMATRTQIYREQKSHSPTEAEGSAVRGGHATTSRPALLHGSTTLQGSYSDTEQTSLMGDCSSQLQDRTQFSDADIFQLKRYWDRGMTSLGSVCREKINAAANQLSVDTEIVKTWVSNRRRKYRLMGIEIPPPQGGPAVFTTMSPAHDPCSMTLSPDGDRLKSPDPAEDFNDAESTSFSEDGTIDSQHRDGEDTTTDGSNTVAVTNIVKIEVIGENEEDEDNGNDVGEFAASDLEQMQNLLEFKHEEVQFLENELENQKQRYLELLSFTKSLLSAVRNNDLERQQELMASLPHSTDQDWDAVFERGSHSDAETADLIYNQDPTYAADTHSVEPRLVSEKENLLVKVNKDCWTNEDTGPPAPEEQMQESYTQ
uniref:Highly divergent homeobox n=1 Tax=Cynoglossus semilaevis TaxID=244447 RepID=A0A3P8WLI6_CYNSE